jgi:hypothetical protein
MDEGSLTWGHDSVDISLDFFAGGGGLKSMDEASLKQSIEYVVPGML